MQQRIITAEEMKQVNPEIVKRFGVINQINGGTFVETKSRKKQYHIILIDPNLYKQAAMLRKIAQLIKKTWDADEVYHFGALLA